MSSSLVIAPLKFYRGDLEYKTTTSNGWVRLVESHRDPEHNIRTLIFDDGISIIYRNVKSTFHNVDGAKIHNVKIMPTSPISIENGAKFILETDCVAISDFSFTSSPIITEDNMGPTGTLPQGIGFSLAMMASSIKAIRLKLCQSDCVSSEKADTGFLISQMKYLACNKAGPVSRADWALFVKEIDSTISKAALTIRSSAPLTISAEDHRLALKNKLAILDAQKTYAKERFDKLTQLHEDEHNDEMKRFDKEQKEIRRQLEKVGCCGVSLARFGDETQL